LSKFIADTMALVLALEKRKMPERVKIVFEKAKQAESAVLVPSIVFAELAYLSEKNRIETNLEEARFFINQNETISELPMTLSTVMHSFDIKDIPELHDRIIAGSAKEQNIPILTNDPVIHSSRFVQCVWI